MLLHQSIVFIQYIMYGLMLWDYSLGGLVSVVKNFSDVKKFSESVKDLYVLFSGKIELL